ncbi:DegT/DnrJ/EryC1/StrS family aminotransferase [Sulfurimonas sp. HSL-1716]|uniref:DegT/DnrJ/EryC1/StrS family aminotransferase n=1 Tax=Hydrocurvibacter sulfurireducens TaxID=3131937 RepID=UPI0031F7B420
MEVPFYRQESGVTEHDNIADVLDGDEINFVEKLEEDFRSYTGATYAIATSSGTSALHLAMLAIDLKRGDKVICSVNAFPSVPEVVRHFDAEPTFIDIDPKTYNIDLDKLESYLEDNSSRKLKAVIVSHIAGQCVDLDRLYNIAKIYDVKIVEDAADALGATYNGSKIGATGADITCFSFSPHLKNSISNGGMMVTDDEEIQNRARLLRNHAMVVSEDTLDYIYDVVDIGNKYTMSQLDAAYISAQLERQDQNIKRQREIAHIYSDALNTTPHISLPNLSNGDHAFALFIIEVDKNRDSFAKELEENGIKTALHYIPLHLLSYYKTKYMLRVNDFPVALKTFQKVLSIPIFASMSDAEIKYVIDTIKKIAKTRV